MILLVALFTQAAHVVKRLSDTRTSYIVHMPSAIVLALGIQSHRMVNTATSQDIVWT